MVLQSRNTAILAALASAALYGISAPSAKLLLIEIPPALMASLLYLGAGIGMLILNIFKKKSNDNRSEVRLSRQDLPFIIGMIALDIAAPILLMIALNLTTSANASLLNNFEIVTTALIALLFFKEAISRRMWLSIALITVASIILSFDNIESFSFSIGSVFVIGACLCWGLENNCTRMLAVKDPMQIVVVKGFGSGIGSMIIVIALGQKSDNILFMLLALALGFVAYGLSIYLYVKAQRELGAARTSTYYAIAPFVGVLLSLIIYSQQFTLLFVAALLIMLAGSFLAASEKHKHLHRHDNLVHEHLHNHLESQHNHKHEQ